MSGLPRNLEGALWLALTMALFASSDTALKLLLASLPVGEVMGLRGLMITAFLSALAARRWGRLKLADLLERVSVGRALIEVAVAALFFASLRYLPLATAVTLILGSPIIMTIIAALFLREPVGLMRWTAVLIGFVGVLLVIQPTGDQAGWPALLAIAAAILVSIRDLMTRYVPSRIDPVVVALTTALAVTLAGSLSLPLGWVVPSGRELALLAVSAACIAVAYVTIVVAFRLGEASFIAPFRYVSVPLSMGLGLIVFGDMPTPAMMLGALIIIGAGSFIFHRERRQARRAATA